MRDCPRTRCGDLHQGSQVSTYRIAQPPARDGAQSCRGGSLLGRGGSRYGRGGGRGGSQSEEGSSHCYDFPGRPRIINTMYRSSMRCCYYRYYSDLSSTSYNII